MSQANKRNVEIKAKLNNKQELDERVRIAQKLTGIIEPICLGQRDIFFNTLTGRLKLRTEVNDTKPKLIHYKRSDIKGPKVSEFDYVEIEVKDAELLEKILANSMGTLGELKKSRVFFMHGRTRIHFDMVMNKESTFYGMEFEVILEPEEDIEVGKKIIENLMKVFKLNEDQLLEKSYFEILNPQSDQN